MILTHFLALIAAPARGISPAAAVLALTSSSAVLGSGRLDLAQVPALPVRAAPSVLAIRER